MENRDGGEVESDTSSPEELRKTFRLLAPENMAVLTDPQAFFDTVIQDLMEDAAAILLNENNEYEDPLYMEIPGGINYDALLEILRKQSIPAPVLDQRVPYAADENEHEREEWLVGKITVKVAVYYRGWVVVVKPAREADIFAEGPEYFFDAKKILTTRVKDNEFKGKSFWEVEAILKERQSAAILSQKLNEPESRDCTVYDRIIRVRTLIKDLLYDLEFTEEERIGQAKELMALRLETGAAAVAVIRDFIFEFTRKNGWTYATGPQDNTGTVQDGDGIYERTLAKRLIVGEYDLRNLVL